MKTPNPPFLQFNLYFDGQNEAHCLAKIYSYFEDEGKSLDKTISVVEGKNTRDLKFSSIHEMHNQKITLLNDLDIKELLHSPNMKITALSIESLFNFQKEYYQIITYGSVSEKASQLDTHPILILSDGTYFEYPINNSKKRKNNGVEVYSNFLKICSNTQPTYAAITLEYTLECKIDLIEDNRSYGFRDFYVDKNYLGLNRIIRLKEVFDEGYIEDLNTGCFFSTSAHFNPEGKNLKYEKAISKSVQAASIITKT